MIEIKKNRKFDDLVSLSAFSIAHFAVDFCCAFLLFRLYSIGAVPEGNVWRFFLVYNALAFGLEVFIGPLFRLRTAWVCSAFGCALLALGLGLGSYVEWNVERINDVYQQASSAGFFSDSDGASNILGIKKLISWSLVAYVLAGIGNAFFHVGGGIDALTRNIGKYWRGGVFISTGAVGLGLGTFCGRENVFSFTELLALLVVIAILIWYGGNVRRVIGEQQENTHEVYKERFQEKWVALVLFLALSVVGVRSFVGFVVSEISANVTTFTVDPLIIAFASFVGKFVGGFCADLFGAKKVVTLAGLAAIPMLCFIDSSHAFLVGIVLLNMSTAISLLVCAKACVGRVGFAFGLTTLALLAGYLLYDIIGNFAWCTKLDAIRYAVALLLVISTISLFVCLWLQRTKQV